MLCDSEEGCSLESVGEVSDTLVRGRGRVGEGCSLESVGEVSAAVTKASLFCSQLPTLTQTQTLTLPRP